jgi:hypothetical protein
VVSSATIPHSVPCPTLAKPKRIHPFHRHRVIPPPPKHPSPIDHRPAKAKILPSNPNSTKRGFYMAIVMMSPCREVLVSSKHSTSHKRLVLLWRLVRTSSSWRAPRGLLAYHSSRSMLETLGDGDESRVYCVVEVVWGAVESASTSSMAIRNICRPTRFGM